MYLRFAVIHFAAAAIAAFVGFGGFASSSAEIIKIICFAYLLSALLFLIAYFEERTRR